MRWGRNMEHESFDLNIALALLTPCISIFLRLRALELPSMRDKSIEYFITHYIISKNKHISR